VKPKDVGINLVEVGENCVVRDGEAPYHGSRLFLGKKSAVR